MVVGFLSVLWRTLSYRVQVMPPPTLPEHRDRRRGIKEIIISTARDFVKESWIDIVTMAALAAAALGIYQAPLAVTRTFAVEFNETGDIVSPEFAYPDRGWIISSALSAVLSVGVPGLIILLTQIRVRSFRDTSNAIIGLFYSLILSTLFQVVLKMLVGGFRPYFLSVCKPDVSPEYVQAHNSSGLNGVGFRKLYFTSDICTTDDHARLKTAMTSFPSGHTTAAWAGFFYLFLYLNAKLKVWADYRPAVWKLPVIFAPILGAVLISSTLCINWSHNWYDVAAGGFIGTIFALACYRMVYAAIWDWRFNHIPLQPAENFLYEARPTALQRERPIFTHRGGWGLSADSGSSKEIGEKEQVQHGAIPRSSNSSGTAFGHGPEGSPTQNSANLRFPPQAASGLFVSETPQ